ncbi:MAG: ATP-grasp domain-containing protein [Oscillospiraceae bacterium]|nr:ATP-grasp domain-containing protein [Oscillospiraceae bacterium]
MRLSAEDDDALLQYRYALALKRALLLEPNCGEVTDPEGCPASAAGKTLFLRTTSEHALRLLDGLCADGARPLETRQGIYRLKHWFLDLPPEREIRAFPNTAALRAALPELPWVRRAEKVFLKTVRKGVSGSVRPAALEDDAFWAHLAGSGCLYPEEELLLSAFVDIARDELGTREWRCFVLGGQVCSVSRAVHSLAHMVPDAIRSAAERLTCLLCRRDGFPDCYVLDLMETTGGQIEIVELNPVSSSMCYVNNSIFTEQLPEVREVYARTGLGYEFCLDALRYPGRYHTAPHPGMDYVYQRDCSDSFDRYDSIP